jgi:peptide/nickel transport system permease protein
MGAYIVRRVISMVPSLLIASVIIFLFIHLIPGDPAEVMLGDQATEFQIQELRRAIGLDRPLPEQYAIWLSGVIRGDLGTSIFFRQPVARIIGTRAETSIFIAGISMMLILCVGLPIGVIAAVKANTWVDQTLSGGAMFFASIPTFWLGLNLIFVFAVTLRWLPSSGFPSILESGDLTHLRYLILPCITLAAPNSALIIRLTRSTMMDVANEDYVRTARAKGLSPVRVDVLHILRNALIPIVSTLGFTFVALVSNTVVTETVFALPGIGRLVVESLLRRDYPVIQGITLVVALLYMLVNLIIDLSYAKLDPRIRYS